MQSKFSDLGTPILVLDYASAQLFVNGILTANKLFMDGNFILIHTARGALTEID